jgi:hypothetical protein
MTAQFAIGFFPSSQGLSRGGDPGIHAKGVEKPVRREQVEIAPVRFQGILKYALSQADLGQGERLDLP